MAMTEEAARWKQSSSSSSSSSSKKESGEDESLSNECRELLASLPKERGWRTEHIYLFQGFWCQSKQIQAILSFQKHFHARNGDILVATIPKSGTTWLKALTFAIVNRHHYSSHPNNHPLLTSNPHDLVPFLEYDVYANHHHLHLHHPNDDDDDGYLSKQLPRIFGTHIPFHALADSVKNSSPSCCCKIVYICRNPFDTFVSSWIYLNKVKPDSIPSLSLEEAFNMYCKGAMGFGPFWDHMLGYWKASLANPDKVLFLKYEDMKNETISELKKLALFLGYGFTENEEKEGVIKGLADLCSFEKMKELEVNKKGKSIMDFENKNLFRKAEVGDWVNYLSPLMEEQLSKLLEDKLGSSGLHFTRAT